MQQLAKINWNSSEKVWGQKQMKRGRKLANTANRPNRAKRQNDPNFLLCGGLRYIIYLYIFTTPPKKVGTNLFTIPFIHHLDGGNSSIFYVHPYLLGVSWSNLTIICFKLGWFKHQLVTWLGVHPLKLTYPLKIDPWKRRFLLETTFGPFLADQKITILGTSWSWRPER